MKKILLTTLILVCSSVVSAQSYNLNNLYNQPTQNVSGYINSNGTYVEPYTRTIQNNNVDDNIGTTGQDRTIYEGPRGGTYYPLPNGRRKYLK